MLQAWETQFQKSVKNIQKNSGLTVRKNKQGNVELRYRTSTTNKTVTIPFKWQEDTWEDAYTRIRNIYKFLGEGHNLRAAAELAQGKAPKKGKDWVHILDSFKDQKINFGTAITEATFNKQYLPPCEMVVDVMSKKNTPTNPADLIDICV